VDAPTLDFYERNAAELAVRYESVGSPVSALFSVAFSAGARVLDVGAGSGRDLAALLAAGYDAYGVEPSASLRAEARQAHPEIAGRLVGGSLPAIGEPLGGQFNGFLCCAVLMHLQDADLFDAVLALRGLLKPHGRLLLSLPAARDDVGPNERDPNGRLFKRYDPDEIQLLLERIGFQQIGRWETADALQRAGTRWVTQLFELRSGGPARAIDQIEGILNRDRKEATYKLALFRALAEIATQEPRAARWLGAGEVAIPIERIAERWLGYYWPIVASGRFVPQSQAEGAGSTRQLSFRATLAALVGAFAGQGEHGGLAAWHSAVTAGELPAQINELYRAALRAIAAAIRSGPVTYSGGALETGPVFGYDRATRSVVMSAAIWREISLLGHWIVDAVIVRWAALTERFAVRQGIHSGDVLPLLLARPDPQRATALARQIFVAAGVERCVWTGRDLRRSAFAVDHVIPFALWGNNDLWNLQPAHPTVNGQKSDKLPKGEVLLASRAELVGNWQRLREAAPVAFDRQAAHLVGDRLPRGRDFEGVLFSRLREAVELTAMQRGVERWAPPSV
jgi:SAM-dependent methyltransferase